LFGILREARSGQRGGIAILLLLIVALELVSFSVTAKGSGHDCRHGSCPMMARRPASPAPPACHGSPPVRNQGADACSISAGCDCGRPHLPSTPYREIQAILPPAVASLAPDLSSFPPFSATGDLPAPIRDLDAPPPRLAPSRQLV
jgi:hypothetical protein